MYSLPIRINPGCRYTQNSPNDTLLCLNNQCKIIPQGWKCSPSSYDSNDGCNCLCGIPDPDCLKTNQKVEGCPCSEQGCDNGYCVGVCSLNFIVWSSLLSGILLVSLFILSVAFCFVFYCLIKQNMEIKKLNKFSGSSLTSMKDDIDYYSRMKE